MDCADCGKQLTYKSGNIPTQLAHVEIANLDITVKEEARGAESLNLRGKGISKELHAPMLIFCNKSHLLNYLKEKL